MTQRSIVSMLLTAKPFRNQLAVLLEDTLVACLALAVFIYWLSS